VTPAARTDGDAGHLGDPQLAADRGRTLDDGDLDSLEHQPVGGGQAGDAGTDHDDMAHGRAVS
jgi:hypothetical protein